MADKYLRITPSTDCHIKGALVGFNEPPTDDVKFIPINRLSTTIAFYSTSYIYFILDDGYSWVRSEQNNTDYVIISMLDGTNPLTVYADGELYNSYCRVRWSTNYKGTTDYPIPDAGTYEFRCVGASSPWFSSTGSTSVLLQAHIATEGGSITSYPITYSITNATVTPQPSTVTEGQTVSFTVTANDGYHFDATPEISYLNSSGAFTYITATDGVINATFEGLGTTPNITLTANAIEDASVTYPVTYSITNATVTPQPSTVTEGQTVSFTVTANDGYHFDATPEISYLNSSGAFTYITATDGVINATFEGLGTTPNITLTANAIPSSTIEEKYGIIRVYKVSADDLRAIANYDSNNIKGTTDLTKYITSLRRFYFDITTTESVSLRLGSYSIGRTVNYVTDDIYTIDCGSITITPRYNNAIDYKNSDITLWLPFVGQLPINVAIVMNSTINLQYKINIISGDCIALIMLDETTIASATGNISYPIPYEYDGDFNVYSNLTPSPEYMLDLTPYALIIEAEAISNPRFITDETPVTIGDCNGYCEFADFTLAGFNATRDELNEITSLLNGGVIL